MTTLDYLQQLKNDKDTMVENLTEKGITGLTGNETFTELVPEVLNIPSGGSSHAWSAIGYNGEPKSFQEMFDYSKEIYDNWDNTIIDLTSKFSKDQKLIWFPLVDTSNVTSMSYMFYNCTLLKEVPQLNTSNVTNMSCMFSSCTSLKEVPQLNTSNVTYMSYMFQQCELLENVPQFDTSNVTKMSYMFKYCTSLKEVPQLNTSNVKDMSYMFYNCTSLKEIPQLNTSNVTDMSYMFYNCTSLKEVPQLNTSNVKFMGYMFQYCDKLTDTSIDNILQFCITSKVENRTLRYLGFNSNDYPINRIEALPHYQDFLDAGWTIGY